MPKYYCDYCDTYLTHDSPSVRKTHCSGRKHKDNVKFFYQKWMEEQAQSLIDATTAAFKAGKIPSNPFVPGGAAVPPPPSLQGPRGQLPPGAPIPPMGGPLPPNMMIPGMRPPMGPMMSMGPMPMRPPMGPMMPMGPMPVRPPMMMGPQPPS